MEHRTTQLQMPTLKHWESTNHTMPHIRPPMYLLNFNQLKQITLTTRLNTLPLEKTQLLPTPVSLTHRSRQGNTTIPKTKAKESPRMTTWEESPPTTTLTPPTHLPKITHSTPTTPTCLGCPGMLKTLTNQRQSSLRIPKRLNSKQRILT